MNEEKGKADFTVSDVAEWQKLIDQRQLDHLIELIEGATPEQKARLQEALFSSSLSVAPGSLMSELMDGRFTMDEHFEGVISCVTVHDHALTSKEVQARFEMAKHQDDCERAIILDQIDRGGQ